MLTKDKVIYISSLLISFIVGIIAYYAINVTGLLTILRVLFWLMIGHIPFVLIAMKSKYKKFVFVPTIIFILFVIVITLIYVLKDHQAGSWDGLIYAIFMVYGVIFTVVSFGANFFIYRRIRNHLPLFNNRELAIDILTTLFSALMLTAYIGILSELSISLAMAYYLFVGGVALVLGFVLFFIMKNKFHLYKLILSILPLVYVLLFDLEGIQDVSTVLISSSTVIIYLILYQLLD